MLFNSLAFIFGFLPLCLGAFALTAGKSRFLSVLVLALGSLAFYGWFDIFLLPLILVSIAFNYGAGLLISRSLQTRSDWSHKLLGGAVAANLALLVYFKYANFFLDSLGRLGGPAVPALDIVLPLGISFFTFTQIAFLVDVAQGKVRRYDFLSYLLFVTYFPHLIAGPILHHGEMIPQFERFGRNFRFSAKACAMGLSCFAIGLIKKLGLADGVAPLADLAFGAAQAGQQLSLAEAWTGALAYSFQIYFDFSGYCDMAVGLSLLFGVRLPANFNSPYKAASIIDFWRRWHMTLSRFLKDYVYIPLGGNRHGAWRRYVNLGITMILGGLWHGAGWTFVVWGALHGAFLVVNHFWRRTGLSLGLGPSWLLTFACVTVAWVFFRADSLDNALGIVQSMIGLDGQEGLRKLAFPNELVGGRLSTWAKEAGLMAIVLLLPNSQQLLRRFRPVLDRVTPWRLPRQVAWRPNLAWGLATGLALSIGITLIGGDSPFLYFQF